MTSPTTVGVIGLGNIGSSIAMHLIRNGFSVIGTDIRSEALETIVEHGGRSVEDAAAVASESDVVITSLPSEAALTSVLDEIVDLLAGKTLIETSTLSLQAKEEAYARVDAVGGQIVDAPLSGTAMQAREGDVVAYTSADAGVTAEVQPVLDGFCRATYAMDPFGTATKMKLVANLLVAVHNVAAAEALVLAQKAGLDLDQAVEVLSDGAGSSRMLQVRGPMMAGGTYDAPGMNVGVFIKDIELITNLARELEVPVPLLSASSPVYASALAQGWAPSDTASVFAVLARMADLPVSGPATGPALKESS